MYLIIGGTKFLGRHLVDSLLASGHEVALFNRGKHPAGDMPDIEVIHGDRNKYLNKLVGRKWDAVFDTCGYLPSTVTASARFFSDTADTYVFVSSMSCYADASRPNFDESTPVAELTVEQKAEVAKIDPSSDITAATLGEPYGALKALCEQAAEAAMRGRVLHVRSGLIVGPYDTTDRFTYWVMRTAGGGEVLAPGDPGRFVQLIDVRDLADWAVKMAGSRKNGTYNVTGKPFDLTMGGMLAEIKTCTGTEATFAWAPEEFLLREKVAPWSEMPLYLPESDEESAGFLSANIDKALGTGLTFRPFRETILDTLQWRGSVDAPLKAGITTEREAELIAKLKNR